MKTFTQALFRWGGMLTLCWFAFTTGLQAQGDARPYSLKQCIDYALQHNTSVQVARFDQFIALKQVKEFRGIALPQARAGFELQNYQAHPHIKAPVAI